MNETSQTKNDNLKKDYFNADFLNDKTHDFDLNKASPFKEPSSELGIIQNSSTGGSQFLPYKKGGMNYLQLIYYMKINLFPNFQILISLKSVNFVN